MASFGRLIVAIPFLAGMFCLYLVLRPALHLADLQFERVTYSRASLFTYGISTRYQAIKIETAEKEYLLYPDESFIVGMSLEEIAAALQKTTEATIWTEKGSLDHSIKGIETKYLIIPPAQAFEAEENHRRFFRWTTLWLFVASAGLYVYSKRNLGLDWKLGYQSSKPTRLRKRLRKRL